MVFSFLNSIFLLALLALTSLSLSSSFAAASSSFDRRSSERRSEISTACSQIFNSDDNIFAATLAYDCLISVPFNQTVATQFLQYYKDTLQFQSTLAYLKNPPPSYQQPSVDLIAGLDLIQRQIDTGVFQNEYAFEAALQNLIYSTHDGHIQLSAGALAVFTFGSPLPIVSLSADGFALPKVYITYDIWADPGNNLTWAPSPIATINGQEVTNFLSQFAVLNVHGGLEPHADWNQLMTSAAADIQGNFDVFYGATPFYPGDLIEFTFENGSTSFPLPWEATYSIPDDTPPINSGQDFYDFFVLGIFPPEDNGSAASSTISSIASETIGAAASSTVAAASASASSTVVPAAATSAAPTAVPTSSATGTPVSIGWDNLAYPDTPDVAQPNLGIGGGVLTGYFLNDTSTAVISIPSFELSGEAIVSFSTTIKEFLERAQTAGMKKVVVDLQQNGGGDSLLAADTFKQFFPYLDPFGGSRLRAFPTADALGNTYTTYYNTQPMNSSFYAAMSADVWVASDFLDADTGMNFTSWGQLYGPHPDNGDYFSTTIRDNFSSVIFDVEALGIVIYGFANNSITSPQPFKAEDIVILTDAYCASTCAVFVEMMHHQAGVKTVVAGGRPEIGPMQAVGGVRGSQSYATQDIDSDIEVAILLNSSVAQYLPNRDVELWVTYAQFNLMDQIRKDEYFPLQFAYEAADCRIFYTPATFYNYTNLWNYAANAIWFNPALCVSDSTGQPSTTTTDKVGPSAAEKAIWAASGPQTAHLNASSMESLTDFHGLEGVDLTEDITFITDASKLDKPCRDTSQCATNQRCIEVDFCSSGKWYTQKQCKQTCTKTSECGNSQKSFTCNLKEVLCTKARCVKKGFCEKTAFTMDSRCNANEPKPVPTLAVPFGSIVIADQVQPTNKPKKAPPKKALTARTKNDLLGDGTLGGAVLAGMAAWE